MDNPLTEKELSTCTYAFEISNLNYTLGEFVKNCLPLTGEIKAIRTNFEKHSQLGYETLLLRKRKNIFPLEKM